jgi:hypothetical protein
MDGRKQVVDRYLHSLLRHHYYPAKILVDHGGKVSLKICQKYIATEKKK